MITKVEELKLKLKKQLDAITVNREC